MIMKHVEQANKIKKMDFIATHKKLTIDTNKRNGKESVAYLIGNDEGLYRDIAPGQWRFLKLPDTTNEYMNNHCYSILIDKIINKWPINKRIENQLLFKKENKKEVYLSLLERGV